MRLQVKKLEGPNEVIIGGSQQNTSRIPFTLHFNRSINATDIFPMNVAIKIYSSNGTLRNELTLPLNRFAGDRRNFNINNLNNLTGTHIHVHALLPNGTISRDVSAHHETIKKVHLAAEKRINHIYWSNQEVIEEENMNAEESQITNAYANEDAFIHIKTQGMYNSRVNVFIYANESGLMPQSRGITGGGEILLIRKSVQLSQNRKVIAISMADVRARYNRNNTSAAPFDILVTVEPDNYLCFNLPISFTAISSEILSVQPTDTILPCRKTSTGTVYVNVNDNSIMVQGVEQRVTPTRFTDFQLGYVGHLLSTGSVHPGVGGSWSKGAVVLYPFNFYELRLSDLVACNVLTIEDARMLTQNTNNNTLRDEPYMQQNFNKYTAFNGQSMIQRMSNANNRIEKDTIKKILDYVRRDGGRGIHRTFEVCRDAWQTLGNGDGVTPVERYYQNGAECPPGAYTINLSAGTFQVYFSNSNAQHSKSIFVGTHAPARSGLAIHRGDSYFATGCTTLYVPYTDLDSQLDFVEFLFNTQTVSEAHNTRKLILAYIEERNALLVQNYNRRWYDLVAPGRITTNNSITGPNSVRAGTQQIYSLTIAKNSLAPNDTIASEEINSIQWQYKVSPSQVFRDFAAGNGQTQITLPIENSWAGRAVTIIANVTTSIEYNSKYTDRAQITINILTSHNR